MLCMVFALGMSYAQTVDDEVNINDETPDIQTHQDAVAYFSNDNPMADFQITVPIMGKSKFARSHYIYQTVEISTIFGKDKNSDEGDNDDAGRVSAIPDAPDIESQLSAGLNIGYSLIFVPGKIQDDGLLINRFGFAYSTGFIAAFDNQKDYGVTCDFLFKLGVESGNGHPLGIGIDLLAGGGKTAAGFHVFENDAWQTDFQTLWCFKYGAQVWLNTSFLTTGIKNSDILAFARFVGSKAPASIRQFDEYDNVDCEWNDEAWNFGITFRYRF